jgi:DNA-binding MarR family transcriptional regulator
MRGTIVDDALMQGVHVLHPNSVTGDWHVSPGTVLQKIHNLSEQARMIAEREALRVHKIDMRAWLVLKALDEQKYSTQRQIVAATGMDKVAVNRAASLLKERNLVLSLPNTLDGRSHYLELSHEGERVFAQCTKAIGHLEDHMLSGLTRGEGWQLLQHLEQVQQALAQRV